MFSFLMKMIGKMSVQMIGMIGMIENERKKMSVRVIGMIRENVRPDDRDDRGKCPPG
jgi:hypothetical protein